jgi:exonuclease SbcD
MDVAVVGHVRRGADGCIDASGLVVPLRRRGGAVAAWCLAIPFLRPGDLPRVETEGDAYGEGVALLYRQALEHALARRSPGQAVVALGHCHVLGGQISEDSERRITVGGAEALEAGLFDPAIAYVALGHLHLAQTVGGRPGVRYSGSPLPMSFSEIAYPHQVLCVDFEGESVAETRSIRVPRAVELLRVPEKPAPLAEILEALARLDLPDLPDEQRPYLQVRVRLDGPEPGLRALVEAALEGKQVRLARIEAVSGGKDEGPSAPAVSLDDLGRLRPEDVFERLYRDRHGASPPPELLLALAALLQASTEEEGEAAP